MATWPSTLPQKVERGGYQEGFASTVVRSQTDSGRVKRRQRFLAGVRDLTVVIPMDDAELLIFNAFYEDDIAHGAVAFTFPHPRLGTTVTVAFKEDPESIVPEGALTYLVVMKLEILP